MAFALLGSILRRCPSEIEDMSSRAAALLHPTLHTTYISTQQIMQFGPQIESATAARAAGGARRGSARPGPGLSERCAQHSEKLLLQPFSDVCRPFR